MDKTKEIVFGLTAMAIMLTVCVILDIADRGRRDAEY